MLERRPYKVGIDYDGVFIKKAKSYDIPRRATKFGLPSMPGVVEGVNFLREQPDVDLLGVYTVRPQWLREGQTRKQVIKRGYPVERIVHTSNSPTDKVRELLYDSVGFGSGPYPSTGQVEPFQIPLSVEDIEAKRLRRVILIDDSTQKIIDAAKQLYNEEPNLSPLLERFIHIAFNPKQPEQFEGLIIPGIIHVVTMRDWSEIERVMEQIRR
mgnify:CR=1 FL=1